MFPNVVFILNMASLECSICLEEFGDNDKSEKAPKMLSCGHTFCCQCIKKKWKKMIIKLFAQLIG